MVGASSSNAVAVANHDQFEEVFLPHQIVINLERVNTEIDHYDELLYSEMKTIDGVHDFADNFHAEQFVIKLESMDFIHEMSQNMKLDVPIKMEDAEVSTSNAFTMTPASLYIKNEIPFTFHTENDTSVSNQTSGHMLEHFADPSGSNVKALSLDSSSKITSACTICEAQSTCMAEHMLIHTQSADRPFPCKICPRIWFNATDLCTHLTAVHRIASVPSSLTSNACNRPSASSRRSKTKSHSSRKRKRTSKTKPVTTQGPPASRKRNHRMSNCAVCGQRMYNVKTHMKSHTQTKGRNLACAICPQTWFAVKTELALHVNKWHATSIRYHSDSQFRTTSENNTPTSNLNQK